MTSPSRSPPVVSPDQQQDNCFVDTPVAPRSPRSHGMAHSIHHRFRHTMNINSTCNLCEKPMFIGYKCKDCKYRCHRDCMDKVPNSCGLPNELVDVFKQTIANCEERRSPVVISHMSGISGSSRTQSEIMSRKAHKKRTHYNQPIERIALPFSAGHDSSSNTSSCNSSTPSSPALIFPSMTSTQTPPPSASRQQQFQFPEITCNSLPYTSTSNTISYNENYNTTDGITIETKPFCESEVIDTQKSTDSDKTFSGTSGSGSTDSEKTLACRVDSQDSQTSDIDPNDKWPRQNSLTLREWDIPFDELKVEDPIGTGRFGHRVQRQLAWLGGHQEAQHEQRVGRQEEYRVVQARGGHFPEDASRQPGPVHGCVHETAPLGDRHLTVQRHDSLHSHPSAKRQIQSEPDNHNCSANMPRNGLPPCQRNRSQRS